MTGYVSIYNAHSQTGPDLVGWDRLTCNAINRACRLHCLPVQCMPALWPSDRITLNYKQTNKHTHSLGDKANWVDWLLHSVVRTSRWAKGCKGLSAVHCPWTHANTVVPKAWSESETLLGGNQITSHPKRRLMNHRLCLSILRWFVVVRATYVAVLVHETKHRQSIFSRHWLPVAQEQHHATPPA